MALADFARQPAAAAAGLSEAEVLGLRLALGPGQAALSRSLRARAGRFPATQFAVDAALGRLARRGPAGPEHSTAKTEFFLKKLQNSIFYF